MRLFGRFAPSECHAFLRQILKPCEDLKSSQGFCRAGATRQAVTATRLIFLIHKKDKLNGTKDMIPATIAMTK